MGGVAPDDRQSTENLAAVHGRVVDVEALRHGYLDVEGLGGIPDPEVDFEEVVLRHLLIGT